MSSTSATPNLIRLHPKAGGLDITYEDQRFVGVSPDVFIGTDLNDRSRSYQETRKLNLSIKINSKLCSTKRFLDLLTNQRFEKTEKCSLHGDKKSGLEASSKLIKMLQKSLATRSASPTLIFHNLEGEELHYEYDSIGIAANHHFGPVSHRDGNDYDNFSSHFEIKFREKVLSRKKDIPIRGLCLNIHLTNAKEPIFTAEAAFARLQTSIDLFYRELGMSRFPPQTLLRDSFSVTKSNFEEYGFSLKHKKSLLALEESETASHYSSASLAPITLFAHLPSELAPLEEKPKASAASVSRVSTNHVDYRAPLKSGTSSSKKGSVASVLYNENDFPPLGQSRKSADTHGKTPSR